MPSAWRTLAALLALAGCAGSPPRDPVDPGNPRPGSTRPDRDGPEANPPPNLAAVPDAEPKWEPIRPGGPNKPYDIGGETYVPLTRDEPFAQRGPASWYGRKFHGARTASGERYDMYAMTAAHPTLPIPSYARIRNPANGREIVVRINDRGPFRSSRIIDLSYTAALKLDLLRGVGAVEVRRITGEEIRAAAGLRTLEPPRPASTVSARVASAADPAWPLSSGAAVAAAEATPAPVGALPVSNDPLSDLADSASAREGATLPVPARAAPASVEARETAAPVRSASSDASPAAAPSSRTAGDATGMAPLARPDETLRAAMPTSGAVSGTAASAVAPVSPTSADPASGAAIYWVQLGAFRAREGAVALGAQIAGEQEWLAPRLAIFDDAPFFRLQAGPFVDRDTAARAIERLRRGSPLGAWVVVRPPR